MIAKCQVTTRQQAAAYVSGGLITGCVISNNLGPVAGVDMEGGVMEDCTIVTNRGNGGGNGYCGGLYLGAGVVRRCRIIKNISSGIADVSGVWLNGGRLEDSLLYGNSGANNYGNGIYLAAGVVVNCTIAGNAAGSSSGSGVYRVGGSITNSIIYGNGANGSNDNYSGLASAAWYSCAPELTNSTQGNTTNNPLFVALASGNCRLKSGSPCINTGTNQSWMFPPAATAIDLDGNKRVFQAIVDMGAYEAAFQGATFLIR